MKNFLRTVLFAELVKHIKPEKQQKSEIKISKIEQ